MQPQRYLQNAECPIPGEACMWPSAQLMYWARQSFLTLLLFVVAVGWLAAGAFGLTEQLLNQVKVHYGEPAMDRLLQWQSLVQHNKDLDVSEKLEVVNRFFNQSRFVSDIEHWKREDYWATPVEFLSTNGGDCEDFSIAKYFTLKEMGVPVERMRITYVKAVELNQAHMVLTYYSSPDAEPLVLDNLIDGIWPASQRDDLVPVYSFNGDGLWLSKERGQGRRVGGSERIALWRDLGIRLNNENKLK
ncbi:transglutaminase-like cysteine peptidase [Sulfuriflexus mobilis]|uniref:transglutaminase-like cysteine peptidase n=1 Tax=Sulfuriflexus mobilis TaxID=1811807 RepID=UPI0018D5785B|nr:transglutaminase-like cysteine peptidase [Sulfuriflexus mobilis]